MQGPQVAGQERHWGVAAFKAHAPLSPVHLFSSGLILPLPPATPPALGHQWGLSDAGGYPLWLRNATPGILLPRSVHSLACELTNVPVSLPIYTPIKKYTHEI